MLDEKHYIVLVTNFYINFKEKRGEKNKIIFLGTYIQYKALDYNNGIICGQYAVKQISIRLVATILW